MRYKAVFVAGVAVGFIAGTRAGRETYDQMAGYAKKFAANPKVQQAASAVQAKTAELTKTAAAKAPEAARSAVSSAASTVSTQVPKMASAARHVAQDKLPARLGGSRGARTAGDPAADGSSEDGPDDVAPDGNLVYPAHGQGSVNGTRYSPDMP